MKITTRDSRIKELNLSIKEISLKYNISYERARQIVRNERAKKLQYYKTIQVEYTIQVDKLIQNNLQLEIKRLSNKGRTKEIIIQKIILIRSLRDNYFYPFIQIAKLFNNNYHTIRHLYYSHKEG